MNALYGTCRVSGCVSGPMPAYSVTCTADFAVSLSFSA